MRINWHTPHERPKEVHSAVNSSFTWGDWGIKGSNKLPKFPPIVIDRAGFQKHCLNETNILPSRWSPRELLLTLQDLAQPSSSLQLSLLPSQKLLLYLCSRNPSPHTELDNNAYPTIADAPLIILLLWEPQACDLFMPMVFQLLQGLKGCRSSGIPVVDSNVWKWYHFIYTYFYFFHFRAAPAAYGGSQTRGRIWATAANLHHSHSNAGSTERGQGSNPQPHGY